MGNLHIELQKFEIVKKNEFAKDEPYLWVFGVLVDYNTFTSTSKDKGYIIKKNCSHRNLGKGLKKGVTYDIPAKVGTINKEIRPIRIGAESTLMAGVIVAAWEQDNTPNDKVEEAYSDTAKIIYDLVEGRVQKLDTSNLTKKEISELKSDIYDAVEKRFKSAVKWYNPFSLDVDDFVDFKRLIPDLIDPDTKREKTVDEKINFNLYDEGQYNVRGLFKYTP